MIEKGDAATVAEEVSHGLLEGQWSPDTALAVAKHLVKRSAGNSEALDTVINLYARASVAKKRGRTSDAGITRGPHAKSSSSERGWRVVVGDLSSSEVERWTSIVNDIAPEATVVHSDKPFLYGDADSYRKLSRAIRLALGGISSLSTERKTPIKHLLEQVDEWLLDVDAQ